MSFLIDFHVHTDVVSSCGEVSPDEVVQLYTSAGYDGILITDHFNQEYFDTLGNRSWHDKVDCFLEGYRQAVEAARSRASPLKVFLGLEYRNTQTEDDFLIIGMTEQFLYDNPETYLLSWQDAFAQFRAAGMLVVQAHPVRMRLIQTDSGRIYRNKSTRQMLQYLRANPNAPRISFEYGRERMAAQDTDFFSKPVFLRICELQVPELLDGIEAYNGNTYWVQSPDEVQQILVDHPHLFAISSSDFHEREHLARGGTVLDADIQTLADIVQALKDKKIKRLITTED